MLEHHGGVRGPSKGEEHYAPTMTGTFRDPLGRTQDGGMRIKNDEDDPEVKSLNRESMHFEPEFVRSSWQK